MCEVHSEDSSSYMGEVHSEDSRDVSGVHIQFIGIE